jgi:hypothetical protein
VLGRELMEDNPPKKREWSFQIDGWLALAIIVAAIFVIVALINVAIATLIWVVFGWSPYLTIKFLVWLVLWNVTCQIVFPAVRSEHGKGTPLTLLGIGLIGLFYAVLLSIVFGLSLSDWRDAPLVKFLVIIGVLHLLGGIFR